MGGILGGPAGAGAGAMPMGGGMGPGAFPPPPPAPINPPVGVASKNNLLNHLMTAISDPQQAATMMAQKGISPGQFAQDVDKGNKVAELMNKQAMAGNAGDDRGGMVGSAGGDRLGDLLSPTNAAAPQPSVGKDVSPTSKGSKTAGLFDTTIGGKPEDVERNRAGLWNFLFGDASPNVVPPHPQAGGASELMGGNAANRGGQQAMPIAPPIMPPEPSQRIGQSLRATEQVPSLAPETPREALSGAQKVYPSQPSTVYPTPPELQPGVKPAMSLPEVIKEYIATRQNVSPEVQNNEVVRPSYVPPIKPSGPTRERAQAYGGGGNAMGGAMGEDYLQPTRSATTSYALHGGAERADAILNMDRQFKQQLEEMYGAAPPEVQKELGLTSAYRDVETQRRLWEKSDKSGRAVARPGGSRHNYGKAADLFGFGMGKEKVSPATFKWVQENAKSFGLGFPVKGEPWHIEQLSPEGKRIPISPGMVPDEIAQRGQIPQIDLKQRQATGARGMQAVRGLRPEFREWMAEIGQSYGVDPMYLQTIAMIESGGNPNAKNPSGATGLMQFMPGTAKQYRLENPLDPRDSIRAASELAMDNAKSLEKALGRKPSWAEVYLAHQQGNAGAAALLKNPDGMAVDTLGRDAVIGNGGTSGMTNQEFANLWIDKYNGTASGKGGGGGGGDAAVAGGGGEGDPAFTYDGGGTDAAADGKKKLDPTAYPDYSDVLDSEASGKNKIDPPNAIAPSQGAYNRDANMMKLMLAMLMGGGGGGLPTLTQLINGGGGGGNGQQ